MKNMVFLAKAYHSTDTEDETAITVPWMARKLIKEANLERINNAAVTIKVGTERVCVCVCVCVCFKPWCVCVCALNHGVCVLNYGMCVL